MLKKETSIIFLFFLLLLSSCQISNESVEKQYANKSKQLIGESSYFNIYNQLNDSINSWILNGVGYFKYLGTSIEYRVDSLICFNNAKDKLTTCIQKRQLQKDGVSDDIQYIHGVLISEKWFFFEGPSVTLPREMYEGDIHSPLSFDKLHEIAMKEIYKGYLNEKGEINDAFFKDLTSGAWCTNCKTTEDWDKAYLGWVKFNWSQRDTTQPLKQLQNKLP